MKPNNKIHLGPIDRKYIPTFIKWFNDPEITFFLQWYLPMSIEMEEKWYQDLQTNSNEVFFCIFLDTEKESTRLIGTCSIRLNWKDRVGNIGIIIGEKDCWGLGFGTDALTQLINYGFKTLNLHRIELETFDHNLRAIRCYEKVGFFKEGARRQAHFIDGKYHDILFMGILREEWKK